MIPRRARALEYLENVKGKGKVIHVQDRMCTIETYEFDMMPAPTPTYLSTPFFNRSEKVHRNFVDVQRGDYARKIGFWTRDGR